MTATSRIAKQVIQTAKSFDRLLEQTQAKWKALTDARPAYILFDNPPSHPYTALVDSAEQMVDYYKILVSALLDLKTNGETLRDELDKIQAKLIYDNFEKDAVVEAFRLRNSVIDAAITADYIADSLHRLQQTCASIKDASKLKVVRAVLVEHYPKRYLKNHIENPFFDIASDCRSAVKDLKKLCDMLLQVTVEGILVISKFEENKSHNFLKVNSKHFQPIPINIIYE